ncbi:alcohol dehydrogenase [Paucidesulfovibrio gracilis DSM 16080]|uniref:Alcohol dehydrogenase n=1 Tax=Paucidesulfovibrio gracilis DSM 16080 TaxID=1121449 RepID=A0A1T4XCM3_9BACT|nr:iron-containing alcohol dehydrogenase [Paucidesulfovibrio gracilis]SKA87324.1 alcohol dehydrogenase [Paucidesulfovibrio gracilis DSM 16080]
MLNFQFFMPTRLIFGPGSLAQLGDTAHLPKGEKAMIFIGASGAMVQNGYLARVQGLLAEQGVRSVVYDKVRPNPESAQVEEAAQTCRELGVDFLVGLGGGSTIDTAKAVALLATNPGSYWDYMQGGSGGKMETEHPGLPLVAIPTTAGTGTEADPWTVITKTGSQEKIGFGTDQTFPALSIVDPELMVSLSPRQTAYTGMDAFFHAVESYLNTRRSPMNDMLAMEAVNLIGLYLPDAVADGANMEARTALAWASTAAGICETIGGCISHHSLEHALSGFNPDLPHGAGLVLLAPHYFKRLGEMAPQRFSDLALALGDEEAQQRPEADGPALFLAQLVELIQSVGLADEKLTDYGFSEDQADALAQNAFENMGKLFPVTPAKMSHDDVAGIFRAAINA